MLIRYFVFLLFTSGCFARGQCDAIDQAKAKTYGFHPSTLSKTERHQKSKQMDEFWKLVESNGTSGLECVRQLMARETTDTYFLFDGASLLADMDKSGSPDNAIVERLTRIDMKDLSPDGFIHLCLQLSRRNVDIGPAAKKYLYATNVTVYLPRHGAYKLDRPQGAILLYGSLSPNLVDRYLIPEPSSSDAEVRDLQRPSFYR